MLTVALSSVSLINSITITSSVELVGILLLIFSHGKSELTIFDLSLTATVQCMTKCYLLSYDYSFFITVSSEGLGQKLLQI